MAASLARVLSALEELAPLRLAEDWDNVGLLLEPRKNGRVRTGLLTIDLSDAVLEEAIQAKCELIVAYHPPIFGGLKRLDQRSPGTRRLLECARRGIAIYSPHTALDAVAGGVNDWLADGLGKGERSVLQPKAPGAASYRVRLGVAPRLAGAIASALEDAGCRVERESGGSADGAQLLAKAPRSAVPAVRAALDGLGCLDAAELVEVPAWPDVSVGPGRRVDLQRPVSFDALVRRIKKHLGLARVRVAVADRHTAAPIESIALCAGAGGSVLEGVRADVFWTGEMRHHDVLAANAVGTSVVLCEHTNTERGFLPILAERLGEQLGAAVRWTVAQSDADPLRVV